MMKKISLAFIMVLLLVGCRVVEGTSTSSEQPSPQIRNLPEPTIKDSQIFTPTPFQSQPDKSSTPIVILTSSPTTLGVRDRQEFVYQLLRTNGNCPIPCFFGVTPQKTTLNGIRQLFDTTLGKGLERKNANGEVITYGTSFSAGNWIVGSIKFNLSSEIVQSIEAQINGLNEGEVSPDEWSAFSLRNTLLNYGVPSNILFSVGYPHEPVSNPGIIYSYSLLYKNYNTRISYMGGWKKNETPLNLCLSKEHEIVRIEIGERNFLNIGSDVEINGATSMTPEDFYNIFSKTNNSTCIDLKLNAFNNK